MTIKAVLFDLWGTLILDSEDRWRPRQARRAESVRLVLSGHSLALDRQAIGVALEATGLALSRLHDAGRDVSSRGRVVLFLEQLSPSFRALVPATAAAGLETAICGMESDLSPRLAPDALNVLEATRGRGLMTALVSNAGLTSAPYLRRMLAWQGIGRLFDGLVFSDEAEVAKPDRRIFDRALIGLGVAARDAVFVGDSPHHDILGAQEAGLLAVQIGHRDGPPPSGYTASAAAQPDTKIEKLANLLDVLDRLEASSRP
jgi:HAD superfamily hydrolase (TIGR01509 family)